MEFEFSRQIFKKRKHLNIEFNGNQSSERAVPFGRTDTSKLIVAFRNFSNAPKKLSA